MNPAIYQLKTATIRDLIFFFRSWACAALRVAIIVIVLTKTDLREIRGQTFNNFSTNRFKFGSVKVEKGQKNRYSSPPV